jgi:hypothetical protein
VGGIHSVKENSHSLNLEKPQVVPVWKPGLHQPEMIPDSEAQVIDHKFFP